MAKVIIGNASAITVPRRDRDSIRGFYCDVLGGKIVKESDEAEIPCRMRNSTSCFATGMSLMRANSYGLQKRSGCKSSPTMWKK